MRIKSLLSTCSTLSDVHPRRWLRTRIADNVIALYGVQACTYFLPLITFPYLARTLGPGAWGAVLFAQSIGAFIAVIVEYGFDFSATRETARSYEDKSRLKDLIAGVLGAKAFLSALCLAAAFVARPFTLRIAPEPVLYWASIIWGIGQGINMLWYFQGQQRMRVSGALDVGGKAIATLSIFVLVHRPTDGWKVMVAQALGCVVAHGITVAMAYAEVGFRLPTVRLVSEVLRVGWALFLFRASQILLTSVNGIILGFLSSPAQLGLYVGADKIGQVSRQSLWPLTQALFPHQAQKAQNDPRQAALIFRRSVLIIGGLGLCSGLVLILGAPLLIRIALGNSFDAAIPTLRVLGLLTPLSTLVGVVGFQWMLPLGMDRQFTRVFFTAGLLHVAIASALTLSLASLGMAIAVVCSQAYILVAFEFLLRRARLSSIARVEHIPEEEEELAEVR